MVEEGKSGNTLSDTRVEAAAEETTSLEEKEANEGGEEPFASAKDIPEPATLLAAPPRRNVGEVTVSLLSSVESAPLLEDVERTNANQAAEARTPLMTVIHALLASRGGSMTVAELATQVRRYWNRPFPGSPYTDEEFVYVMVRDSDDLRVDQ